MIIIDGRIAGKKIFSRKLREEESSGRFMELFRKRDRINEFTPKSGADYFSLFYKTDVCNIEAFEPGLPVAIETAAVATLCGQVFEGLRSDLLNAVKGYGKSQAVCFSAGSR